MPVNTIFIEEGMQTVVKISHSLAPNVFATGWVSDRTLSPPSTVIGTFIFKLTNANPDGSTLPQHFMQSLKLALSSFVVAVVIGVRRINVLPS